MEKNIKISISSRQAEISKALIDKLLSSVDEGIADDDRFDTSVPRTDTDTIELHTDGKLKIENGRAEISYDESEITGMEGSHTALSFMLDDPGVITMLRDGTVSTAMVFEEGKRHICIYETGIMPFEICIDTVHVRNELLTRGAVLLDYIIEIKGGEAGRTKFEMKIEEESKTEKKPLNEYNE